MTEITFTLCGKPILGTVMWLASLCANNQLLDQTAVDLTKQGDVMRKEVVVPMDDRYRLTASFHFPDRPAYEAPGAAGDVAQASHPACKDGQEYEALAEVQKRALGAQIVVRVSVADGSGNRVVQQTYSSRCVQGWGHLSKTRGLGWLDLKKGRYVVTVENLQPLALRGETVTLALTGAGAGYP